MEILTEEDPMGLVELGAPRDEYAPEASDLITIKQPGASDVSRIFMKWFDAEVPDEVAARVAERIAEARVQHGLA
jgi:hypothetical protein